MDILDDMGVSKLSANVFSKVNYSFNGNNKCIMLFDILNWQIGTYFLSFFLSFFLSNSVTNDPFKQITISQTQG